MPNWRGCNSKALEAREAKKASKEAKQIKEQEEKERKLWEDNVTEEALRKKESILKKKQDKSARKAEVKKLAEEEEKLFAASKKSQPATQKLTRSQIMKQSLATSLNSSINKIDSETNLNKTLLVENVNILKAEERRRALEENKDLIFAESVDEYLQQVEGTPIDRAPERRMKAQYAAYSEKWLPILTEQYPGLKFSQLKDRLWKQWQKAPENPLVQAALSKASQSNLR